MATPPRQHDLALLVDYFEVRVRAVIAGMQARGFDPVSFETLRSQARQRWLYGIGRTHDLQQKPATWTMHSKHLVGKACDIISASRKWDWPEFYAALKEEALAQGLKDCRGGLDFSWEQCHVEWDG